MLVKRNLIFLSLFILGVLLLSSCFLNPPATEGILKGQIIVPEGTLKTKDLTGQALPDATVNIIDLATGAIIATTTTDASGYYQVFVPAGGPYLLEATKDGVKVQQFTPRVEVGIEYDLGTADCSTTTVALIAQAMLDAEDYPNNPVAINLTDIEADPNFNNVMSIVCSTIEAGGDPTESALVQQEVEDFLNPPEPAPAPAPAPTYTVTFDSQGGSAVASQTVVHGGKVTKPTAPTRTSYTFGGWYKESGCTTSWVFATDTVTADVPLYAKWTINSYTVTFDSAVASQTVEHGGKATEPTAPTKTGYTFGGWYKESGCTNAWDFDTDTVTSDVPLYAKWTPLYALRDTGPAGGLIFYVKEGGYSDGWMYLEAAPSDQGTAVFWGCSGTAIGTKTGVGEGEQNTIDIENGCITPGTAADICANLILGDWFLPSKAELDLMYDNLHNIDTPVGGFADSYYWSSSEYDAGYAWSQFFYNGAQYSINKDNYRRVRAVRAF